MGDLENCNLKIEDTNLEKEGAKIAEMISINPIYRLRADNLNVLDFMNDTHFCRSVCGTANPDSIVIKYAIHLYHKRN